ncbi:MAG: nucleotidyltransferase family protein [Oscillospiraceae bacterium]|nr:nucleotidyltransferase family protein [Oscillospiraceae bacterium]
MADYLHTKEYFLKLVAASICGDTAPTAPEDIDYSQLARLAFSNSVQTVLYLSVKDKKPDSFPEEHYKKLRTSYMTNLMREASQSEESAELREIFTAENIDFMLLKGSHLKALYPVSEMRFMVDMDILVREKDLERARDIVLSRGYHLKMNNSKDIVLIKEPFLTVEVHKSLFTEEYFMHGYFANVWERAEQTDTNEYKMSANDLYVYTLAHLTEHYTSAGSCFRPMMDLYLMEKRIPSLNFEYITEQFRTIGIEKFAQNIRQLCKCMFEGAPKDKTMEIMENYIVLGPPVKNADVASKAATSQKSKAKRIFETAFPNFKHMALKYPLLKKAPFLLPAYWVIRLFSYLFSSDKSVVRHRKGLISSNKNDADIMQSIFKESGL